MQSEDAVIKMMLVGEADDLHHVISRIHLSLKTIIRRCLAAPNFFEMLNKKASKRAGIDAACSNPEYSFRRNNGHW